MKKYIYPQLSLKKNQDFGFFRIGGPGLANCLFVAARAFLRSKDSGYEMLRPTWERLSLGQWLRGEKDKRFYHGLFKDEPMWKKIRKAFIIRLSRNVETEEGLGKFFEPIITRQLEVRDWFFNDVEPSAIEKVPNDMRKSIAVHVRLGDFPAKYRLPNEWYASILKQVSTAVKHPLDIQIFSDGRDEELKDILSLSGAHRVFYGNAIADIVAISRCGLLVAGKYSTFATWGAYLGNVPSIFPDIDYGRVVPTSVNDIRLMNGSSTIPDAFLARLGNGEII